MMFLNAVRVTSDCVKTLISLPPLVKKEDNSDAEDGEEDDDDLPLTLPYCRTPSP